MIQPARSAWLFSRTRLNPRSWREAIAACPLRGAEKPQGDGPPPRGTAGTDCGRAVLAVRRERLDEIISDEVPAEGFPEMTPRESVEFFCAGHLRPCAGRTPAGCPSRPQHHHRRAAEAWAWGPAATHPPGRQPPRAVTRDEGNDQWTLHRCRTANHIRSRSVTNFPRKAAFPNPPLPLDEERACHIRRCVRKSASGKETVVTSPYRLIIRGPGDMGGRALRTALRSPELEVVGVKGVQSAHELHGYRRAGRAAAGGDHRDHLGGRDPRPRGRLRRPYADDTGPGAGRGRRCRPIARIGQERRTGVLLPQSVLVVGLPVAAVGTADGGEYEGHR